MKCVFEKEGVMVMTVICLPESLRMQEAIAAFCGDNKAAANLLTQLFSEAVIAERAAAEKAASAEAENDPL